MTVTAYQGAVNKLLAVPENRNNSYVDTPPCADSDILPFSPAVRCGCALSKTDKKCRYLLLSITPLSKPKKKRRNVVNRVKVPRVHHQVSQSGFITHKTKGEDKKKKAIKYKVQSGMIKGKMCGIYLQMLHKMIDQIDIITDRLSRVLLIRIELHQKDRTGKSGNVSIFSDKLTKRLKRAYKTNHIGYAWAREHEKAKAQHYHFFILIDGHKAQHPSRINQMIRSAWESTAEGNTIFIPDNCFYYIDSQEKKAKAIERISYLCKSRGKGYRDKNANDYNTSRLKQKIRKGTP